MNAPHHLPGIGVAELYVGINQKMVGACFQFRGTSKTLVPLMFFQHHIPAQHRSPRQGQNSSQKFRRSASPPTWRHAADDVSHQLRSSVRLCRTLAPSSRSPSHIVATSQKNLVRAWCGPGAGLVRAWCGLQDRSRRAGLALRNSHWTKASAKTYVNMSPATSRRSWTTER